MTRKMAVVKPQPKKEDVDPRVEKALVILKRMLGSFRQCHPKAS